MISGHYGTRSTTASYVGIVSGTRSMRADRLRPLRRWICRLHLRGRSALWCCVRIPPCLTHWLRALPTTLRYTACTYRLRRCYAWYYVATWYTSRCLLRRAFSPPPPEFIEQRRPITRPLRLRDSAKAVIERVDTSSSSTPREVRNVGTGSGATIVASNRSSCHYRSAPPPQLCAALSA
jgi:hypothetical protein